MLATTQWRNLNSALFSRDSGNLWKIRPTATAPGSRPYHGYMYGIALSVTSCLRAQTRADVAWVISSDGLPLGEPNEALALTPGGGRIGNLLSGAIDGDLIDFASRHLNQGRVIAINVSEVGALIAGIPFGGSTRCVLTPAAQLPAQLWPALLSREPLALICHLDGDVIHDTVLFTRDNISESDDEVSELFRKGSSRTVITGEKIITIMYPVTKLAIAGGGPIAEALAENARLLGWRVVMAQAVDQATGLMADLASIDAAVIMGHDVESSSMSLAAALESDAGYIGALGSQKMQQNRADWLAYRGITEISRVHGPAGVNIGATSPAEIAISILAQAIEAIRAP